MDFAAGLRFGLCWVRPSRGVSQPELAQEMSCPVAENRRRSWGACDCHDNIIFSPL